MNCFKSGPIFLLLLSYFILIFGNNCLLPVSPGESCTCCESGYMGADCTTPCPNCQRYLYEKKCVDECKIGYHGKSCDENCSVNCVWGNSDVPICEKGNGFCTYGCKTGYYGQQCESECNMACRDKECSRVDGMCFRCNSTLYSGFYCNVTCNTGCLNKTCEMDGTCIGECNSGHYGPKCDQQCGYKCINNHCIASRRDRFNCTNGCKDGYTLSNCTRKCPENCRICHQQTGQCTSCMHGFTTHCDNEDCSKGTMFCKEQVSPKSDTWRIAFAVCIAFLMTIIIVIIAVIIVVVCRKRANTHLGRSKVISQRNRQESIALLNHDMAQDSFLHKACHEGNFEVVKFCLQNEIQDINSRGKGGMTPVMEAVLKGQGAVREFLISQGCDLFFTNDDKNTVLHIACRRNDVDFVKYLLEEKKFDINSKGSTGRTPVMMAAHCACKEVFELLRRAGCDLNMKDDNNDGILHNACYSNNARFVKYVLELDIFDINAKGYRGYTPVLLAAYHGYTGVFDELKNHKCDLHAVDRAGDSVLHVACQSDTNSEFVKYLLTLNEYDINKLGRRGRTPVMTAARFGCRQLFDILKKAGCKLKERDTDGDDVLALACRTNNEGFVEYLLSLDIYDINRREVQ